MYPNHFWTLLNTTHPDFLVHNKDPKQQPIFCTTIYNTLLSHLWHQGYWTVIIQPMLPTKKAKESPTYPTDSARGLVEFSETNTWQANLWSAGCFVMKPKYLQEKDTGHSVVTTTFIDV